MSESYKRTSQEVHLLASRLDVKLPSELRDEHKQKIKELSQLSGPAFDREYMHCILRNQQNEVNEFEEAMQILHADPGEPGCAALDTRDLADVEGAGRGGTMDQAWQQTNP